MTLPPGRLRLATRPSLTGSPPPANTIGTVVVAALAASAAGVFADDHGHRLANKIRHECWQSIRVIVSRTVFDRDVLPLDKACFLQTLAECGHPVRHVSERSHCAETLPSASPVAARAPRAATPPPRRVA